MATHHTAADGEMLLGQALEHVESASIRAWATSEHNRPIFVELAQRVINKRGPTSEPVRFATFILAKAIGLV